MSKTVVGGQKLFGWSTKMTLYFAKLARESNSHPGLDISAHVRSDVPLGIHAQGSTGARVGQRVVHFEDATSDGSGDEWHAPSQGSATGDW